MAHINDLSIIALSSLEPNEGLQLILDMRLRRRFTPTRIPKENTRKQKPTDVVGMINALSDEQLMELMLKLGSK